MRKYVILVFMLCFYFILFTSQACVEEVSLAKFDFEDLNQEKWSVTTESGGASFYLDNSSAKEGKSSLLLESGGEHGQIWITAKLPRLQKPFAAGGRVYVRYWYRTDSLHDNVTLKVEGVNKKQDRILETYTYSLSPQDGWVQAEHSFKVQDQNTAYLWLNYFLDQGSSKVWIDDLEVFFEPPIDLKNSPIKFYLEFEDGESGAFPPGWKAIAIRDGGKVIIDGSTAYEEEHSLLLSGETVNSRALIGMNPIPNFVPEIGARYKIKVRCKSENLTGSSFIKLEFWDAGPKELCTLFILTPKLGTQDWYLLEGMTEVIPENTAQCWLNIGVYPGSGKLWVDNLSIELVK